MAGDRGTWLRVPEPEELPAEVLELWKPSQEKLGFVPNVLRFFALRPSHLLRWNEHFDELMKGDSGLTKAEREMIAVVVSVANSCSYCIAAHSAALRKLTKDEALSDQIAADHRQAAITDRMKAALDYAIKLTRQIESVEEADVEALRAAGWTDEDVMDIAEVTAIFNFSNRLASGLGWAPNPEYAQMGRAEATD
ncbi:MAG: peroxidase-related enzyme [Actinobacteria bacterium]|nr:peroxidase-related enzyme [Actinomycetota bacterium]